MSAAHALSAAQIAVMRAEIRRDGLLVDRFLANDPDVATFGLNLACAWPFPEAWRAEYERLARRWRELGPWLYVYPPANTHVTLVTLVSFAKHVRPAPELVASLEAELPGIITALSPLFAGNSPHRIKPFTLQPQAPALARGAGILPLLNPDGEVSRLRDRVVARLQKNELLHRELMPRGLNVPRILHSTLVRFVQPPPELEKFLAAFDDLAATVNFPPVEINEVLLTSETRPYMRRGEILRRFNLAED